MKKLIIIVILALAAPSFAAPLVWQTSKSAAIETAKREGKKIVLVAGRDTCGNCAYMRNTVFESISPPIRCLLEQQFVLWYCNVDASTEYYAYSGGLGGFTLPLISVIDPDNPDVYLDRTTSIQTPDEFYSRLRAIAGSDCIAAVISGSAKNPDGNGIADVMINFSDGGGLARTDGAGYFSHPVSLGWSGTMTPYKVGYVFDPQKRSLSKVAADQAGQDYAGNPVADPYTFELHHTARVASLLMPQQEYNAWNGDTSGGEQADRTKITKFLYNYFKDGFDFIILISNN